jgi:ATP-dependent RNA helicase DeaD
MKERGKIRRIEQNIGRKITEAQIPGKKEICEQQLLALIEKIHNVDVDEEQIGPYLGVIEEKLADLDTKELIKKVVSLEFNRFLQFYKDADDLKPVQRGSELNYRSNRDFSRDRRDSRNSGPRGSSDGYRRGQKGSRDRGDSGNFNWLKINLGHRDGLTPGDLMKLINQHTRGKSVDLGRIDIQPSSTRFQVDKTGADFVTTALSRKVHNGRRIRIDN